MPEDLSQQQSPDFKAAENVYAKLTSDQAQEVANKMKKYKDASVEAANQAALMQEAGLDDPTNYDSRPGDVYGSLDKLNEQKAAHQDILTNEVKAKGFDKHADKVAAEKAAEVLDRDS